jgi:CheY-like chemotaxis protein
MAVHNAHRSTAVGASTMAVILVIDDEPKMRRLIARMLRPKGHVVHEAADGKEGIALFQRLQPALVISDIVMPEGEGIETIRELRRQAPAMPILAISGANAQSIYLHAATSLGASASLEKPFDPDQLLLAVDELLKQAGS